MTAALRGAQRVSFTSFEEFLDARLCTMTRFAMVLCGSRGDAEDLVQDVLVKAHQNWGRISAADSAWGYVRAMLVNEHISGGRRANPLVAVPDVNAGSLGDHADDLATRDDLMRRIDSLPPQQRAAIALRYYGDLDDPEIATALACSPATVRSHISRGLRTLRVDLAAGSRGKDA